MRIVVADLTATTFCDVAGVRALARARKHATAMDAEIRLAVQAGPVRRVLTMVSLGGQFFIYPSVGAVVSLFKGYNAGYKGLIPPYIVLTEPQGRFDAWLAERERKRRC